MESAVGNSLPDDPRWAARSGIDAIGKQRSQFTASVQIVLLPRTAHELDEPDSDVMALGIATCLTVN